MSTNFIYPEVISKVRDACKKHIIDGFSVEDLQATVQLAESSIVAVEEKDVSDYFTNIEGRLELIKFTVEGKYQLDESKKLAEEILLWLDTRM